MSKDPCVYIMTNAYHTVLYTGVTSDIRRRVQEHMSGNGCVFSRRYYVVKLVYVEFHQFMKDAIMREKEIKSGSRASKITLINELNPEWRDLAGFPDE